MTDVKDALATDLDDARHRSLALLEPLTEPSLVAQHSPLMSPLIWDLAHVGNYEDLWLVRALGGEAVGQDLDAIYNPFENPRFQRGDLAFLRPPEAHRYVADVRRRALELLADADLDPRTPLLRDGFVYRMVVQHEHQHDETMLAALQLRSEPYPTARSTPARPSPERRRAERDVAREVLVPAGPFTMGTDVEPWAYDNERPGHDVNLPAYFIDANPVTNGAYAEFVAAGGYDHRRWWSPAGWAWRQKAALAHPEFWIRDGESWLRNRFGHIAALVPDEPVQHVCWYEADAYARFRGQRLPTEAEWEKAASWDPARDKKRRYPWGDDDIESRHANVGQASFGPSPVGSHPDGVSAVGCHQMIGDVWEWTASDFVSYPDFSSFPYREYSEVFYGHEYKVLRGGSWATHPRAIRNTFRNWDFPIRRQIFAGFRCARDVDS